MRARPRGRRGLTGSRNPILPRSAPAAATEARPTDGTRASHERTLETPFRDPRESAITLRVSDRSTRFKLRRPAPRPLVALLGLLLAGCGHAARPAPGASNLSFRDGAGVEVARGWLDLPGRLPGPGRSFGGAFKLVSVRGDFPADAIAQSGRYAAFVAENGSTLSFNLNPAVADNNVTLSGQATADEVRGQWQLSTFGGLAWKAPRGTFVLAWPRQ
jgi:hypothetical protein